MTSPPSKMLPRLMGSMSDGGMSVERYGEASALGLWVDLSFLYSSPFCFLYYFVLISDLFKEKQTTPTNIQKVAAPPFDFFSEDLTLSLCHVLIFLTNKKSGEDMWIDSIIILIKLFFIIHEKIKMTINLIAFVFG